MGKTRFGGPKELIVWLRNTFEPSTFIETGTYMGDTAAWAAGHFEKVITIEGLEASHRTAREKHRQLGNIEFLLGDSRTLLPAVLAQLPAKPAVFWLDAHWMPNSFGKNSECPVLEEIRAVAHAGGDHLLLIDDARLFLAPPPLPHRATDWPDITAILMSLQKFGDKNRQSFIYEDVIINVPDFAGNAVRRYLQDMTTSDLAAGAPPALGLLARIARNFRARLGINFT